MVRSLAPDAKLAVACEQVSMAYNGHHPVLRDLDLRVEAGQFYILTGPNGAGKTSLLRLLSLAQAPDDGRLRILDRDIHALDREERAALRRQIGVVFQEFRLLGHLSAFDNVALPLRLAGAQEHLIEGHVAEMLKWLGLGDHVDQSPDQLSIGQQQLVAVARAVVARPKLLLADEPTSNLDERRIKKLMYLFIELQKMGTAIILATHNTTVADEHQLTTLHMDAGRIVKSVPPKRVRP